MNKHLNSLQNVMVSGFEYQVSLYFLSFDIDKTISIENHDFLSHDERLKAGSFKNNADQVRFGTTRSTLKTILSKSLNICDPSTVEITPDTFGKPKLLSYIKPNFNVSHSGNKALIAISNEHKVGVDIECKTKLNSDIQELKSYILSRKEYGFKKFHCSNQIFNRWVIKESILKAVGCGLSHDMTSFSVFQSETNTDEYYAEATPENWKILKTLFFENESYIAALTIMKDNF